MSCVYYCQYIHYKYAGPLYCQAEMYAGHVACCPLVSHVEYALYALLGLEKTRDGRTQDR